MDTQIFDLIGNFGVPIVLCVFFGYIIVKLFTIYRNDTQTYNTNLVDLNKSTTESINNNTNVMEKLIGKLDGKEDLRND